MAHPPTPCLSKACSRIADPDCGAGVGFHPQFVIASIKAGSRAGRPWQAVPRCRSPGPPPLAALPLAREHSRPSFAAGRRSTAAMPPISCRLRQALRPGRVPKRLSRPAPAPGATSPPWQFRGQAETRYMRRGTHPWRVRTRHLPQEPGRASLARANPATFASLPGFFRSCPRAGVRSRRTS